MKKKFPRSLLMAPAYLALGLVNLYVGRRKNNKGSTLCGPALGGRLLCVDNPGGA